MPKYLHLLNVPLFGCENEGLKLHLRIREITRALFSIRTTAILFSPRVILNLSWRICDSGMSRSVAFIYFLSTVLACLIRVACPGHSNIHLSTDKSKNKIWTTSSVSLYFSDRASWYQSICYNQLDAHMFYFVIITPTCFGHYSVHHQEVSIVHAPPTYQLTFNQYRAWQPVRSDTPDGACTIRTSWWWTLWCPKHVEVMT
jgi:hypothetical protein